MWVTVTTQYYVSLNIIPYLVKVVLIGSYLAAISFEFYNVVLSESPCVGAVDVRHNYQRETTGDTLRNLYNLFCGCQFITRSVVISFTHGNNQILREKDFDIFYHIREIRNSLFLKNVYTVPGSRIILPNLRIIRGENTFSLNNRDPIAVRIQNVNASELIMPRLTEISIGGIHITESSQLLSNLRGVLLNDIIDQTKFKFLHDNIVNWHTIGRLFLKYNYSNFQCYSKVWVCITILCHLYCLLESAMVGLTTSIL